MSEIVPRLVLELGVGGVLGFLAGYALKKVFKVLAVLLGLATAALIYLSYVEIISINYEKLYSAVRSLLGLGAGLQGLLVAIVSALPFAGSFAAGGFIGLKKG